MEYAADDINIGYMSCLLFINNEHTLIDKLSNVAEVQPMQHIVVVGICNVILRCWVGAAAEHA